jgi:outer membrane protein assembly factor BamB
VKKIMLKRAVKQMSRHSNSVRNSSRSRIIVCAVLLLGCVLAASLISYAEHTRRWRQSSYDEFLKGTTKGIAVRSDGHLELAPKFSLIADADASYLWSLRNDAAGVLYAAGGSPAKVFRFEGAGKPKTVFESTDLLAQSIAFDSKGNLYVGTSPDGKVYKVSANSEKSVFFDPKTKYIWDLAFAADGTLFVATGDKGQIYAVAPDGKGDLFYASDEAHIKILGFDAKGNLLAGTEPNGRILRVIRKNSADGKKTADEPAGEGFVLYETAKREVTSLAVATDGTIYVGAIGEKTHASTNAPTTVIATSQGTTTITNAAPMSPQVNAPFLNFPPAISSSIYKLAPDGAPEELWSSRDDVVYALGLSADGRLLAGTGNNGSLLVIDGRGVYAQLAKSGASQITGITRNSAGKIFLCTANPGKVFSVGPEFEAEGTFESQSFDAKLFSQWGRLEWWGPAIATTAFGKSAKNEKTPVESKEPRLEFFVRSGNTEDPGKEWSKWFGPYTKSGAAVEAPAARFFQWKAVIHDGRAGDGLDWVSEAYQPRNVAPVIDGIAIQDPGVRAQAPQVMAGQPANVVLRQPPAPNPNGVVITTNNSTKFEQPPQATQQKGYESVLWTAHDDNDDDLKYAVYFRGENEHDWRLLKDNLDQKFYSWDATTMPDGAYYLKIVASDSPSNPPAIALKTERESERFEIDNTPPVIDKLEASATGMNADRSMGVSYDFQFNAVDSTSSIERAQYSVDGGDWILLAPVNGISDSRTEGYSFTVRGLAAGEHTIAVRAYDRFENVGAGKTTINIAGQKN